MESDLCVVLVTVFSVLVSKGKLNPERSNTNYRAPFFAFKKTTFFCLIPNFWTWRLSRSNRLRRAGNETSSQSEPSTREFVVLTNRLAHYIHDVHSQLKLDIHSNELTLLISTGSHFINHLVAK